MTAQKVAEPTEDDPRAAGPTEWVGLAVVLLAAFMGQVDLFVVNTAGPSVQADLDATFSQIQWAIGGYVAAYASAMVLAGRLGDRFGRRRLFRIGSAAFTVTSATCAASPTVEWLIAARVAQGLSAALLFPQVLALVRASVSDPQQRQRAIGWYGTTIGLGVVAGLAGGGILLELDPAGLGWRSVFLINVPIGLAILAASPVVTESRDPTPPRLDLTGAALTALALPTALVPLTLLEQPGAEGTALALLPVAVVAMGILVWHQRRTAACRGAALWPARVLRQPGMGLRLGIMVAFYAGNAALFLAVSYHLQNDLGLEGLSTGGAFLPLGIGFALASALSHRAGDHAIQTGALTMTAGLSTLAIAAVTTGPNSLPYMIAGSLALGGLGQGLVVAPLVNQTLALVPTRDAGAGSGVLNTTTQASMALGIAAGGLLYATAGIAATATLLAVLALIIAALAPKRSAAPIALTRPLPRPDPRPRLPFTSPQSGEAQFGGPSRAKPSRSR